MDFQWIAIAMGDVSWLAVAFVMGYLAHLVKLPPLIGFLCAGFVLNGMGFTGGEMLNVLSDLGVTLLLFAVGLKLDIKSLAKPQIWGVTSLHMVITIAVISGTLLLLKFAGLPMLMELPLSSMVLIAFALSFSSTVFAVKILEEKFEMASMHGKIAIGILVMQDLFAVLFLAASEGKMPAWYAPLLIVGLFLIKPLLFRVLKTVGYGELLILFALVIAIGGSTLFEMVGIKDDLGALFIGVLVASHSKAKEMAKSIMSFKDIFLVGFFLTIFFWLMTRMKVRARPAFLATLSLSNYSEFGLIVAALGASQGWISSDWLIIIALALSLSFIVLAPLCRKDHGLYDRFHEHLLKHQRAERMPEDQMHDSSGAQLAVIGMGRVG
ncbi:MAG: cation:proton antiporter, partial [Gammaproteobacteria bacterium]